MLTMTSSGLLDESKLRETLGWRSDQIEFAKSLDAIKAQHDGSLQLIDILDACGLEKALWAVRALATDEFDSELRLMACDIVEAILRGDQMRDSSIRDTFPFDALELSRKFALGIMSADEEQQFENRITYTVWFGRESARWANIDASRFGHSLCRAAVSTMIPEAKIATYFGVLEAHSRRTSEPAISVPNSELKIQKVRNFFQSLK